MLIAARDAGCLAEMTVIAAALSVQDARERPFGQEEAADQAHRKFADDRSEFLGILKRWRYYDDLITHKKSNRKLADELKANFLHTLRMREWRDVYGQLHSTMSELGWHFNELPSHEQTPYEQLHQALLAGLLGNIACKDVEDSHFEGARGIKVLVWPGSSLAKKAGRWIVAAELVETSRLFARTIAKIEPEWVERAAGHLLRKSHGDPHWEKRSGKVVAFERATLYGLTVYHGRRVDYGTLDPQEARKLFIRGALVNGEFEPRVPSGSGQAGGNFLTHNLKLVSEIEKLEHKSRRLDVLVDEELIYAFYDAVLPADVFDAQRFENWYRRELKQQPRLLYLDREDVMRHEAAGITTDQFPKRVVFGGVEMALDYHFEPGNARDGVTLSVPLYALNLVDESRCEWLVPGMRRDKVQALLKSLPQKLRRNCVPLPEYAAGFVERIDAPVGTLVQALIRDLRDERSLAVLPTDFKLETLSQHMFMNFRVVDEHGRQLGLDRSLPTLRATLGRVAREQFQQLAQLSRPARHVAIAADTAEASEPQASVTDAGMSRATSQGKAGGTTIGISTTGALSGVIDAGVGITDWSFGELPEIMEIRRKQGRTEQVLIGYPALVDGGIACRLEVYDDPAEAQLAHRKGLLRLFALQLREPLKLLDRNIPQFTQMAVQFMALGSQEQLKMQIIELALERACMAMPLPLNAESFKQRCVEGRSRLGLLAGEIGRLAGSVLADYAVVMKKLPQARSHAQTHADLQQQLAGLMTSDFLLKQPYAQLAHFSRYLKGMALRIDKLRSDPARDSARLAELQPLLGQWQRKQAALKGQHDDRIIELRWLLEELRISLFAQELRTPMPVSVKRVQKVLDGLH
jgi:ATP-dependent helicase HrpA